MFEQGNGLKPMREIIITGEQWHRTDRALALTGRALVLAGVILLVSIAVGHQPPLLAQAPPTSTSGPAETTPATWPLLQLGDSGAAVSQLQSELSRMGIFTAPRDGVYGPNTEAAVKRFQQQQGLTADGVVGTQTWQALAIAQSPGAIFDPQTFSADNLLVFTPLTFSQPPPPPSPFWLVLMPLVPLIGGTLTYLQRRLRHHRPIKRPPPQGRLRSRKRRHPRG